MGSARAELRDVLLEARSLLALPGNNFDWSWWEDAEEALREIDHMITLLEQGWVPARSAISVLFAPGGPITEVSLSSGWSQKYLALAERFDAAAEAFRFLGP